MKNQEYIFIGVQVEISEDMQLVLADSLMQLYAAAAFWL
jgi:hypothetical protein